MVMYQIPILKLGKCGMPEKILIVDDDKDFRMEFKDALEEYDIIEAASGQEALKLLKKANDIDLVILDVVMPGLSGTEVLRELRRTDPSLGVVILTGYSTKDVAIEALKNHADDYIEKPADIPKVKDTIQRVLGVRREGKDSDPVVFTDKVERLKRFAERNHHRKISLRDAAEAVCLSPKYLSRIFKENTGMGFSDYRLKVKVEKSKELLEKTGYNINQVAEKLGYENTESFIRQFKKLTGCTPSEYRKKKKRSYRA